MENIPMNQTNDIALWRELPRNHLKCLQLESFYIFGDDCSSSLLFDRFGNIYSTRLSNKERFGKFYGIAGNKIIDIGVVLGEVYAVIQTKNDNGNIQKDLYSASDLDRKFKLKDQNIMTIAFSEWLVIVVTEDRALTCYPANVKIRIPFPTFKIIDSACNNFVQILLTDHNYLLLHYQSLPMSQQTAQNTPFKFADSESLLRKLQSPIKRIVSYSKRGFLIINQDGRVYDWGFHQKKDGWTYEITPIATDGPISEVVGGPDGYVLVHQKDGFCWVWDQYHSRMIQTKLTSISDAYCLYLHNSTPRITYLPEQQLDGKNSLKLCSFNQIRIGINLLFEIRFSNYHIAVNRKKLVKHSEYLRRKYQEEWSKLDVIVLDNYSYATYYEYFRFIHTGEWRFDWCSKETLAEMYGLACDFQEEHLRTMISSKIYDDSYLKHTSILLYHCPNKMIGANSENCEFNIIENLNLKCFENLS